MNDVTHPLSHGQLLDIDPTNGGRVKTVTNHTDVCLSVHEDPSDAAGSVICWVDVYDPLKNISMLSAKRVFLATGKTSLIGSMGSGLVPWVGGAFDTVTKLYYTIMVTPPQSKMSAQYIMVRCNSCIAPLSS